MNENKEKSVADEWEKLNRRIEDFNKELDRQILFCQIGLVVSVGSLVGIIIGLII